jgi:hypothetical protein
MIHMFVSTKITMPRIPDLIYRIFLSELLSNSLCRNPFQVLYFLFRFLYYFLKPIFHFKDYFIYLPAFFKTLIP